MSFKQVKKATYNTAVDALSAVSTGVSVVDKSMQYADNWMTKQLEVQTQGMEKAVELALLAQQEEQKQEARDIVTEANKAKLDFYKAISEQDAKLAEMKESLSAETLAKYQDLL